MNMFIKIFIINYVDVKKYFNGFLFNVLLNDILIYLNLIYGEWINLKLIEILNFIENGCRIKSLFFYMYVYCLLIILIIYIFKVEEGFKEWCKYVRIVKCFCWWFK